MHMFNDFKQQPLKITTLLIILTILLTMKTYLAYFTDFSLGVKGFYQYLILFFNPIAMIILSLSLTMFFKGKKSFFIMFLVYIGLTTILYANVVFFRFFSDFITFSTLSQSSNLNSMGTNIQASVRPYDLLYLFDIPLIFMTLIMKFKVLQYPQHELFRKRFVPLSIIVALSLFVVNLAMAETDRPQLLTRTFDHKYLVKYLGPYSFTIYDGVKSLQNSSQKALANEDDLSEIVNYTKRKNAEPNPETFGIAKDKNIIKIHLESLQSWMIGYEHNGEEVTPFLNELAKGNGDFKYYPNFYHQTGQGKTADAELILDNSIYGLAEGSAFSLKGDNHYQALPSILNQQRNYTSAVFHGDYKTFWNRDQVYKRFGVDRFYDAEFYDMTGDNIENLGLLDKPFFEESMSYLKDLKEPYYAHFLTLTHHYPFSLSEDEATIDRGDTGDNTVDGYIQTARYMDEAVKDFVSDLKEEGMYDDSVIVIYSDHYGISENHNRAMEEIQGHEITPEVNQDNQRVPFYIKVPGMDGEVVEDVAGQVDVMPTLMHLQGINTKEYIMFGTDLFSDQHKEMVIMRNGEVITDQYQIIGNEVFDRETNEKIEETEKTKAIKKQAEIELELSDKLIYGDLFRFYDQNGFEKVDTSQYMYSPNEY